VPSGPEQDPVDPLISALLVEPTDQRTAGPGPPGPGWPPTVAAPYQLDTCFGRLIFNFAELSQGASRTRRGLTAW